MRFRSEVVGTLIIQGAGALAMLLTIVLLGRYLGPASQGIFSRIKVDVEFVSALAAIGLPQAMIYYVQSAGMSRKRAVKLSLKVAMVGGGIAIAYDGYILGQTQVHFVLFAFAAMAMILHCCLRCILLSVSNSRLFNLVTAMPQGILLLYALFAIEISEVNQNQVLVALLFSFCMSAWLSFNAIRKTETECVNDEVIEEPIFKIAQYAVVSGITAICANASILLTVHAIESKFGLVELGVFTFALAIAQGLLVPLNYTIPLLFKRWIGLSESSIAFRVGLILAAVICIIGILILGLQNHVDYKKLLAGYAPIVNFLWILIFAAAADAFQKIIAVAAYAKGAPWVPTASEVLRLIIVASSLSFFPGLRTVDVAWVIFIGAISAAILVAFLFSKLDSVGLRRTF